MSYNTGKHELKGGHELMNQSEETTDLKLYLFKGKPRYITFWRELIGSTRMILDD